jgi:hypothetical protein
LLLLLTYLEDIKCGILLNGIRWPTSLSKCKLYFLLVRICKKSFMNRVRLIKPNRMKYAKRVQFHIHTICFVRLKCFSQIFQKSISVPRKAGRGIRCARITTRCPISLCLITIIHAENAASPRFNSSPLACKSPCAQRYFPCLCSNTCERETSASNGNNKISSS